MAGADGGAGLDARPGWRWDVALSFAGAQQDYVRQVAQALQAGGVRCFYDADEQIELWGRYLAEELAAIYGEQAAAVVLFVSADYAARDWTRHERRAALARAVRERREYVLPARFDDTPLPGLLSDMVTVDLRTRTPQQFAAMIADKLAALGIVAAFPPADAGGPARDGGGTADKPCPRHESKSFEVCQSCAMGISRIAVWPAGEVNSEQAVGSLAEWVCDGQAEARRYLAGHSEPEGTSLVATRGPGSSAWSRSCGSRIMEGSGTAAFRLFTRLRWPGPFLRQGVATLLMDAAGQLARDRGIATLADHPGRVVAGQGPLRR